MSPRYVLSRDHSDSRERENGSRLNLILVGFYGQPGHLTQVLPSGSVFLGVFVSWWFKPQSPRMDNRQDFWQGENQGAVSLTFDDGVKTHIDNAIPTLDRHDLKGTFYVNPGRGPR